MRIFVDPDDLTRVMDAVKTATRELADKHHGEVMMPELMAECVSVALMTLLAGPPDVKPEETDGWTYAEDGLPDAEVRVLVDRGHGERVIIAARTRPPAGFGYDPNGPAQWYYRGSPITVERWRPVPT